MTPTDIHTADAIADALEECLRDASVDGSLANGWRSVLTDRHRASGSGTVVTAITVQYGREIGWFTLLREDGLFKVGFWTPELRTVQNPARPVIYAIQKCIADLVSKVQVWGTTPYQWLERKGWSRAEIARLRRGA